MSALHDSLVVRALRGLPTERTPIWFMRQAGRFLPEYREVRAQHSMLDVIRTPELAAKVTLQPLDRFPLDAGIIFADILNPLVGMGINLDFVEGEGPKIFNLIQSSADVDRLVVPAPEENIGYTLRAIQQVTSVLTPRGIPLLGFSGAPFTLSAYMVEGKGSTELVKLKQFMREDLGRWHELQGKLVKLVAEYLIAQVRAGVSAVQLFDSWAGALSPADYADFCVPHLKQIVQTVRSAVDAPIIYFSTGTAGLLPQIAGLGVSAVGIDWRITLTDADRLLGHRFPLQGNLDPALLIGSNPGLLPAVERVLQEGRPLKGFVFNVGHGVTPSTSIESVSKVVKFVQDYRG